MARPTRETATHQQLIDGYALHDDAYICLFCEQAFRRGLIHRQGEEFLEAEFAMKRHIAAAHVSTFHALLATGKKGTGLSDTVRALLGHFYDGRTDREIQPLAGGVSLSTLRNHRFALREKTRHARMLVALMELLDRGDPDPGSRFIDIPGTAAADDERFAITRAEFAQIIRSLFPEGPDGPLARFPKKEKHKIAVLIQILKRFDATRRYTQGEVNAILATASDDHTTLCRYLVDYRFLGRTRDGAEYWVE